MGGGESRSSQSARYGCLLSQEERDTLHKLFKNIVGSSEANNLTTKQFEGYYSRQLGVPITFTNGLFKSFCSKQRSTTDQLSLTTFIHASSDILKGSTSDKAFFFYNVCQSYGSGVVNGNSVQTALSAMIELLTNSDICCKLFPEATDWCYEEQGIKILTEHLVTTLPADVSVDVMERWFSGCDLLLRLFETLVTVLLLGDVMGVDEVRKVLGVSMETEEDEELNTERFLFPLKLPPITNGPNDKFSSSLLDRSTIVALNSFMPSSLRGKLHPLFSSGAHGESFSSLCSRGVNKGPTLLVVKDTGGYVFGVYAADSWKFGPQFFGNSDCFLFTLWPHLGVYHPSGYNNNYLYLQQNAVTLPNGLGAGGQLEYFGLWLSAEYGVGHSKAKPKCTTYSSPMLSSSEEFVIDSVELWGVGPPKLPEGINKSILDKDPEAKALLEMAGKTQHSTAIREPPPDDD